MMLVPAVTPVTTPDPSIVATDSLLLLHTPLTVASLKVVVNPAHTLVVPLIAATTGIALTVIVVVLLPTQPLVVTVYEMMLVPAVTPLTTPLLSIVATDSLLLLHTPLTVASLKVVVNPAHTLVVPLIAATTGIALTVIVVVLVPTQPLVVTVYEMMLVPADTPVTTPLLSIVATDSLLLLHTPLAVASVSVVVNPAHTLVVPLIAATTAIALTVTVVVDVPTQPFVVTVYEMMLVPAVTPVTTPLLSIVATDSLLLLHTPLAVASLKVVVNPAHTLVVPLIAATTGIALTVIVVVLVPTQPLVVTV